MGPNAFTELVNRWIAILALRDFHIELTWFIIEGVKRLNAGRAPSLRGKDDACPANKDYLTYNPRNMITSLRVR